MTKITKAKSDHQISGISQNIFKIEDFKMAGMYFYEILKIHYLLFFLSNFWKVWSQSKIRRIFIYLVIYLLHIIFVYIILSRRKKLLSISSDVVPNNFYSSIRGWTFFSTVACISFDWQASFLLYLEFHLKIDLTYFILRFRLSFDVYS